MKEYLQKAFRTYNENKQLYLQVSLVLGMILAICGFVGAISGLYIIFLFLLLPLIVSVFAITMKTSLGKETSNKDLYFGFHHFGMSLVLTTKMLLKPVLMGFLFYFISSLIGYGIVFSILHANGDPIFDIIAGGNANQAMDAMMELMQTNTGFLITTYVSLGIAFIVFYNLYLKRSLSPLICFETTFTMDSAKKMSLNMTRKQNKFFLFNNIFLAMYIIIIVCAEIIQMMFFTNDTMFYLLYFVDILVACLLMAPLLFLNALFITEYYNDKHRDHAIKLFKDYVNVAMRTSQDNVINDEFKDKNDNNNNDIIDNDDKQNK